MSVMKQLEERGNILVTVLLALLLVAALAFGFWAFQSRQDYKNNVDQKVALAVTAAQKQQQETDAKKEAEDLKQPLRTYKSPEAFGSIVVMYPNTWSAFVDDSGSSGNPVNGYFYPGAVPGVTNQNTAFALRIQVLTQSYSDAVANFSSLVQQGKVKAAPYALPKVPSAVGTRFEGQLSQNKTGSMVVLPLRDKTLEISTEANQFENDFNNNILPNLTFNP